MSGLFGNQRSSRRSAVLALPVLPTDENASGTQLGYQHKEGIAWAQNVKLNSRVHLELCITADGDVYIEGVSVADILDKEEPFSEAGHGGECSDTPPGDTVSAVDVAPDRTDALSQPSHDNSGDDRDGDVLPHDDEGSVWSVYVDALFNRTSPIRLELRAFDSVGALLTPSQSPSEGQVAS